MPSGRRAPGYYLCLFVVPDFTPYGAWGKVSNTATDVVLVVVRLSLSNVWVSSPQVSPVYFNVSPGVAVTPSLCVSQVFRRV